MIKNWNAPLKLRAAVGIVASGTLGILIAIGLWPAPQTGASPKTQTISLHSVNKTTALRVVDLKKLEKQVSTAEVTLSNSSNKRIAAYVISVGSTSVVTDLVLSRDGLLAPGAQQVESIALGNFEAAAANDPSRSGEVVISAVAFEDGEGEGDAQQLRMISERHRGAKEQIALMLPLLQRAVDSGEPNAEKAVLELQSLKALPADNASLDRQTARSDARESLVLELQMIEKWAQQVPKSDYKAALNRLTTRYNEFLKRL